MKTSSRIRLIVATVVLAQLTISAGCTVSGPTTVKASKPELFVSLPQCCNNPDGMTLNPDTGDIILACPNFNDTTYPGVLMKIDPANNLSLYFAMPVHPETKRGCPMGLDFGPDGHLYIADNQYFDDKNYKSRLIRVIIQDGKPVDAEVVVDGFKLSNAVIWKGDKVYVSDTFFDLPDRPGMSGIYMFTLSELNKGIVQLQPNATDPHLITTFTTIPNHRNDPAGADGLTFDDEGNLYTGNFGDGVMSKMILDKNGKVASKEVFVKDPKMPCVDGLFYNPRTDEIYVVDMEQNAIQAVSSSGELTTLWQNADNDGSTGLLDGPCESVLRGNELIVANFDMHFPGLRNSKHDKPHTLSVIKLKEK